MNVGRCILMSRKLFNLVEQDYVLELHIPVDYSGIMTVVQSLSQLEHDLCNFSLRHLSVLKALPVFVQFTACQVLHHHYQFLLLWLRDCI